MRRKKAVAAVLYRVPFPVTKVLLLPNGNNYPVCPRCGCTIDREYMNFCDRCGQKLSWELFDYAHTVVTPQAVRRQEDA